MSKIKIKVKKPWIAYPGSTLQQNYAEDMVHGYLLWDIKDQNKFDVKFCELPNPHPFVTIAWQGSLESTLDHIKQNFSQGSRFRIYSSTPLPQKDAVGLTTTLRDSMLALEVTFKNDQQSNKDTIITNNVSIIKDDLRNPEVVYKLVKDYYCGQNLNDETLSKVKDLITNYLTTVGCDEIVRNTKWSIRHLKFENVLAYGGENSINFDNLNGIVGIFGPNRSGKSSVVGTIMYALYNSTDRGSIKNLHVINSRKDHCYTRCIINVNGVDYVIERQTVKNENKRGQVNASTALNVFKMEGDEAIDIAGEQRNDTEKVIKKLIGNPEDFLLTSLSAQDEIKLFISQGSSRRRQHLSKFLDLDIFDKMHDMSRNDLNSMKSLLKAIPDKDLTTTNNDILNQIANCDSQMMDLQHIALDTQQRLDDVKCRLASHGDHTPVSQLQVEIQENKLRNLEKQYSDALERVENSKDLLQKIVLKLDKIADVQKEHNLPELRKRFDALRSLETSVLSIRHTYEKELATHKQREKSLRILDDIPCGDSFPTCKFIKNAFQAKDELQSQEPKLDVLSQKLKDAEASLKVLEDENIRAKIEKLEQMSEINSKLQLESSSKQMEILQQESNIKVITSNLEAARSKLLELQDALKNEENAEIVSLRAELDSCQRSLKDIDTQRLNLAAEKGKLQTLYEKNIQEKKQRDEVLQKTHAYELVTNAFSKKGIPSIITSSQLPIINSEIAKILTGIVDFTVELEADDDSDAMEVYINYGDSRRLIELGSGMEKMIASVAIRVAMINVSSLPKTNMFLIDEGFGALDESGVESCNRLLTSLKRYFKTIIVITHVEGVKDAADVVIEVTKREKDAYVFFE